MKAENLARVLILAAVAVCVVLTGWVAALPPVGMVPGGSSGTVTQPHGGTGIDTSAATGALQYSAGTASVGAVTGTNLDLTEPPAIGGTTPGAVTATTLSAGAGGMTVDADGDTTVKSLSTTAADGSRRVAVTNNTAISPTASACELYPEANVWKVNENGTEYVALANRTYAKDTGANLSAVECSGGVIYVMGNDSAETFTLPAAAAGYSLLLTIGNDNSGGPSYAINLDAAANDQIYLNGTAIGDGDKAACAAPALGDSLACVSFLSGSGAYDWICKSVQGTWTDGGA